MFFNRVSIAAIFFAASVQLCLAQQPHHSYKEKASIPSRYINQPPALDGVPPYQGQVKYVTGYTETQGRGTTTVLFWNLVDPPERVYDWYDANLQATGWTLKLRVPKKTITAQKGDDRTTITINKSPDKGYRTALSISHASYR